MNEMADREESHPETQFAGFWRRVGGFAIDGVALGLLGMAMGLVWSDSFGPLGTNARIFGFLPALLYFGILNSRVGSGQTIGKRLLRIKVVSVDRSELPVLRSLLRFLPVGLPWFLNGFWLSLRQLESWIGVVISMVVFGVGGSVVYLILFNRGTRQSLHDLLVRSFVVRTPSTESLQVKAVWIPHLAVCGALVVLAGIIPFHTMKRLDRKPFSDLLEVQERVSSLEWVVRAQPFAGTQTLTALGGGRTTTAYLNVTAIVRDWDAADEEQAAEIAGIALAAVPSASDNDLLIVTLAYGYDIGIASAWRKQTFSKAPSEWEVGAPAL